MRVLLCCIYLFPIPLHSFAILKKNEAHKTRVSVHTDAIVATTASIARLRMRAHVIILPDTEPPVPIHLSTLQQSNHFLVHSLLSTALSALAHVCTAGEVIEQETSLFVLCNHLISFAAP